MKRWFVFILLMLAFVFVGIQKTEASSVSKVTDTLTTETVDTDPGYKSFMDAFYKSIDHLHDSNFLRYNSNACLNSEVANNLQRSVERESNFCLRLLFFYCSLREVGLLAGKERLFPTTHFHCVVPSCEYFIFALRRIII